MGSSRTKLSAFALSALALSACHGPQPANPPPEPAATSVPVATSTSSTITAASAPLPAAPSWVMEPIATAVTGANGCALSAGHARIALTVDGTAEGVFVTGISGATGELLLVPGGRSAARITLGAAVFDTGLWLPHTTFSLRERPAPLGGILHVDEHARFRVIGGSSTRLSVGITGYGTEQIEWVAPPSLEVACEGLGRSGPWAKAPTWPDATQTVYRRSGPVGISAQKNGPVVVRIVVPWATSVETAGARMKVRVSIGSLGTVVGWSSEADWTTRDPRAGGQGSGFGTGMGRLRGSYIDCPYGAPLALRRADKLYLVGHLLASASDARKGTTDWRLLPTGVRLEAANETIPDDVPWLVSRDDFRVTNHFWHEGVVGSFVVPKGPDGCKLAQPPTR